MYTEILNPNELSTEPFALDARIPKKNYLQIHCTTPRLVDQNIRHKLGVNPHTQLRVSPTAPSSPAASAGACAMGSPC